jgi:hypothetical protein
LQLGTGKETDVPLPLFKLGLAAAAGYLLYSRYRRSHAGGSTTNASDAVDDIPLGKNPSHQEVVDAGVMGTFPASDPVSVKPSETAYQREQRLRK